MMYADHIMQKILSVDRSTTDQCYAMERGQNRIFMRHTLSFKTPWTCREQGRGRAEVVYLWVSPEKG